MARKVVDVQWDASDYPAPGCKALARFCTVAAEVAGLPITPEQYLAVSFVSSEEMAEVNWNYLQHEGDTDVITFDCRTEFPSFGDAEPLGELFICPAVAERQAHGRKNRNYSREVALYVVHGILHLCGEDDLSPVPRARMRRREREVMKVLENTFVWNELFLPKTH